MRGYKGRIWWVLLVFLGVSRMAFAGYTYIDLWGQGGYYLGELHYDYATHAYVEFVDENGARLKISTFSNGSAGLRTIYYEGNIYTVDVVYHFNSYGSSTHIMVHYNQDDPTIYDLDGDGIPDDEDDDIDGDGLLNQFDPSPRDPLGDLDGDGIIDADDADMDGDGLYFYEDPDDMNANNDYDGDGIPDGSDPDIDGDGIPNGSDLDPAGPIGGDGGPGAGTDPFSGGTGDGTDNGESGSDPQDTDSGNVYVTNLDGLETSARAIREGLRQRLDISLSEIRDPITDLKQINAQSLTELRDLGISANQAVSYLNDIGVTLAELRAHQNEGSANLVTAIDRAKGENTLENDLLHQDLQSILGKLQETGTATFDSSYAATNSDFDSPGNQAAVYADIDAMGDTSVLGGWVGGFRQRIAGLFSIELPNVGRQPIYERQLPAYRNVQLPALSINLDEYEFLPLARQVMLVIVGLLALWKAMGMVQWMFSK